MLDMTSNNSGMTIGKKLGIGFAAMMAGTLGLALFSLNTLRYVGDEFDTVAQVETKKLDLTASIVITTSEMLSLERGVVNRTTMSDNATAQRFHDEFAEQSRLIAKQVAELRPMLATEAGKQDADTIQRAATAWSPIDEELWKASKAKQLQVVRKILNEHSIPLAAEMQRAANATRQRERDRIAQAAARGHDAMGSARWITGLLIAVCVLIGCAVMWVVRRSTGDLKRMAGELNEST